MEGPTETNNRGKTIGKTHQNIVNLNACIDLCKKTMKCESMLYHTTKKQCTLKDLKLNGLEPIVKKNSIYFSVFKTCRKCDYNQMEGPTETNNRGKTIGKTHMNIRKLNDCIDLCKKTVKCESLLYHTKTKKCTLKDLKLRGSEPIVKKNSIYFSVFKTCRKGK